MRIICENRTEPTYFQFGKLEATRKAESSAVTKEADKNFTHMHALPPPMNVILRWEDITSYISVRARQALTLKSRRRGGGHRRRCLAMVSATALVSTRLRLHPK